MLLPLALLVWIMAASPSGVLTLSGDSVCPSPAEVQDRLRPLLPADDAPAGRAVTLRRNPDSLLIELRNGSGSLLADRRIPAASTTCSNLAVATAVVVATWEVELRGRGSVELFLERPAPVLLVPPANVTGFAAMMSMSTANDSRAGALSLDLETGHNGALFRALFSILGVSSHERSLETGRAMWRRAGVGVGPRLVLVDARIRLDVAAQAWASWLMLQGQGFGQDRSDAAFDAGVSCGPRLGVRIGGIHALIGATLILWPTTRHLEVTGGMARQDIPRIQTLFGGGLQLNLYR